MDFPEIPSGRSPKRELQGPRPAPLKVRKDSHKIRKPPVAPPPAAAQRHHRHAPPQPPPPPPVIIYTVSPKIIHTNPNEFMSLVQRLTGPNTTTYSQSANSSSSSSYAFGEEMYNNMEAISPAARLASIERTRSSPDGRKVQVLEQEVQVVEGIEINSEIQRITGQFPGILSPNPNTLPPIPPSFFSPPSDNINMNNPLSFFHDLSPVLHSNRNYGTDQNSFILPSPSSFISPYGINMMPSPNTLDLFNSLFDL